MTLSPDDSRGRSRYFREFTAMDPRVRERTLPRPGRFDTLETAPPEEPELSAPVQRVAPQRSDVLKILMGPNLHSLGPCKTQAFHSRRFGGSFCADKPVSRDRLSGGSVSYKWLLEGRATHFSSRLLQPSSPPVCGCCWTGSPIPIGLESARGLNGLKTVD